MIKRLSIICLLMFSMAGVKAQTYCYHLDAVCTHSGSESRTTHFDNNDKLSYYQFSFQGDCLLCTFYTSGTWKVDHLENSGVVHYDEYYKNMLGRWKRVTYRDPYFYQFIEVSGDRNSIVYKKISKSSNETWYFHLYSTGNCY